MKNSFEAVMAKRSDTELMKIINGPVDDYQPQAIEAAKKEFEKRNLTTEQYRNAFIKLEQDNKLLKEKTKQPLDKIWKILTFIFPGLFQIIFSGILISNGYETKAKELTKWTLYGFCFYFALILFFKLF